MPLARIIRPALAGAVLVVGSLGSVFVSSPAQGQGNDARVRVAHFSSDAPPIDVYVDGKPKLRNVPFQAMSDYLTLAAGSHTFDVRAAGAATTATPAITVTQDFAGGKNYTVAAIGLLASIQGKAFEDNLTIPAAGKSRIRVIHATPSAPSIDIAIKGGAVLFPKLAFGTASDYAEVTAGAYEIEVREADKATALLTKPVTLQPGGVYTVAAVPAANGAPNLRGFIDVAPSSNPAPAAAPSTTKAATTTAATTTAAPTTKVAVTTTAPSTAAPTTKVADTKAAAVSATKPPATTAAPTTKVADTKAAATTTGAPTTTAALTSDTTAETTVVDTQPSDTAAVAGATETTKPAPAGGVDTGFGGTASKHGSPAPLAALVAVAAASVGGGLLRRRRSRG